MRRRAGIAIPVLLAGCLGPTAHPVTAPVPAGTTVRISARDDSLLVVWTDTAAIVRPAPRCVARRTEGALERSAGDTAWLRSVAAVEPVRAADAACARRGGAMVIAPAASVSLESLVPVSAPVQVGGSLLFIGVVAGASLLVLNAVDGLLGIIGRWF